MKPWIPFLMEAFTFFRREGVTVFSIDAVLLSQFIKIKKNETAIDLGTGCGILPLLLSQTTKARSFVGIEIQKGLAELAQKNIVLNHLQHRISILHQDFRKLKQSFPQGLSMWSFPIHPTVNFRQGESIRFLKRPLPDTKSKNP